MGLFDRFKTKEISELTCKDFAKEFKKSMQKKNYEKGKLIVAEWKKKCPSDGNLGFALIWTLIFENETPKTIFLNMNDIYHVAHNRSSADESLTVWYHDFAYGVIETYKKQYKL